MVDTNPVAEPMADIENKDEPDGLPPAAKPSRWSHLGSTLKSGFSSMRSGFSRIGSGFSRIGSSMTRRFRPKPIQAFQKDVDEILERLLFMLREPETGCKKNLEIVKKKFVNLHRDADLHKKSEHEFDINDDCSAFLFGKRRPEGTDKTVDTDETNIESRANYKLFEEIFPDKMRDDTKNENLTILKQMLNRKKKPYKIRVNEIDTILKFVIENCAAKVGAAEEEESKVWSDKLDALSNDVDSFKEKPSISSTYFQIVETIAQYDIILKGGHKNRLREITDEFYTAAIKMLSREVEAFKNSPSFRSYFAIHKAIASDKVHRIPENLKDEFYTAAIVMLVKAFQTSPTLSTYYQILKEIKDEHRIPENLKDKFYTAAIHMVFTELEEMETTYEENFHKTATNNSEEDIKKLEEAAANDLEKVSKLIDVIQPIYKTFSPNKKEQKYFKIEDKQFSLTDLLHDLFKFNKKLEDDFQNYKTIDETKGGKTPKTRRKNRTRRRKDMRQKRKRRPKKKCDNY